MLRFGHLSLRLLIPVILAHAAAAQNAPGRAPSPALQEQERGHAFVQPRDLMRTHAPDPLRPDMACPGNTPTVNGNDVSVTLKIGYSDHTIWNPGTQTNDPVHLRTYNDCLTGPILSVHPGNRVRITLDNTLPVDTVDCPENVNTPSCFNAGNLHVHGLHVSPAGNSDNVLISVDPQSSFTYQYDIPRDHPAGTFWFHSHRHGSTALSVTSGMEGVLVISGDRAYRDRARNGGVADIDTVLHAPDGQPFPERVMLFQQIAYGCFSDPQFQHLQTDPQTGAWVCPAGSVGVVENYLQQFGFSAPPGGGAPGSDWVLSGRFTEINGKVQPVLTARAGEIERWRMIHGGVRDTINLNIVEAVAVPGAAGSAAEPHDAAALTAAATPQALAAQLQSLSSAQLRQFAQQSCTGAASTQYEIATDGLTRSAVSAKAVNILNPGQRSDALVVFPTAGLYCVLDQEGSTANTIIAPGQRPGSKDRQVLALVVVQGGTPVSGSTDAYLKSRLVQANPDLPPEVRSELGNFDLSAFTAPQYTELSTASVAGHPSALFELRPPQTQDNNPVPNQPAQNPAIAAILGLVQNAALGADPVPYNHDTSYVATLGTVDEWKFGVFQGPPGTFAAAHVFHIHVNPFEILDITNTATNQSIFKPDGTCIDAEKTNSPMYCDQWHVFRDTLFVKPGYVVTARTRYDDFIGEYVLHCHILDHEDQGMMMNVTVTNPSTLPAGANPHGLRAASLPMGGMTMH